MELERVSQTYDETVRKIRALEEMAEMRSRSQDEQTLMDLLTAEGPAEGEYGAYEEGSYSSDQEYSDDGYGDDYDEYEDDEEDELEGDEEEYELEIYEDEDGTFYYVDPDSGDEVPCDEDGNAL